MFILIDKKVKLISKQVVKNIIRNDITYKEKIVFIKILFNQETILA